jgi:hypothetical protein
MRRICVLVAAALAIVHTEAASQVCLGRPLLATNNFANVGAGTSDHESGRSYGVEASFGGPIFALASFDYFDFDNSGLSMKALSGGVGYELSTSEPALSICPVAQVRYEFGLEDLAVDLTALEISPGLAIGYLADLSSAVSVGPFAQGALVHARYDAEVGTFDDTASDTYGLMVLGLSGVFNQLFSVGPSVAIPLGTDNGDTLLRLSFAVALR